MEDVQTPLVTPEASPSIAITKLRKEYQSAHETIVVLDDVDLTINHGSLVVVTGESGSGKTTFLNILAGIDTATAGTIMVDDWNLTATSETKMGHYRNRIIGLVFQFHYLLKEFSALENIMLPAYMAGVPRKEAMARARDLLVKVGLEKRGHHFPSELSGGERQRAAVARALINDPLLILADEPTGNLDERNSRMIEELLFTLAGSLGKTLVLVTHNSRLASDGTMHLHLAGGKFSAGGDGTSRYLPAGVLP